MHVVSPTEFFKNVDGTNVVPNPQSILQQQGWNATEKPSGTGDITSRMEFGEVEPPKQSTVFDVDTTTPDTLIKINSRRSRQVHSYIKPVQSPDEDSSHFPRSVRRTRSLSQLNSDGEEEDQGSEDSEGDTSSSTDSSQSDSSESSSSEVSKEAQRVSQTVIQRASWTIAERTNTEALSSRRRKREPDRTISLSARRKK